MTADQLRQEAYRLLDEADALDPPHIPQWLVDASRPVTAQSLCESSAKWTELYKKAMQ